MSCSYKCYSDTKDIMKKYVNAIEGSIIYGIGPLAKKFIKEKSGYIPSGSVVREMIDKALIMQFDLLPIARKMVMEEIGGIQNGQ